MCVCVHVCVYAFECVFVAVVRMLKSSYLVASVGDDRLHLRT